MNRERMIERLRRGDRYDVLVVGGGATGLGCAVDASLRGYRTALLERADFAHGTSGRSTKLIHGGVRYLRRGNVGLVLESLEERGLLRGNAPHLVSDLPFVVPAYDWWEGPFYGVGLRIYDRLAGRYGFGRSRNLSRDETVARIPTIETEGLRGGVIYYDGQFDDARLAVCLARTAAVLGATVANYVGVTGLRHSRGRVVGVDALDAETGDTFAVESRVVVNATGHAVDTVRRMDEDDGAEPIIRPSRGSHIVLDRSFLPGDTAIMVPHTDDGRVLFAIPWYNRVLVGTTDVPVDQADDEPVPSEGEVTFLLEHAARYLTRDPQRADIRSRFAGIRPLVADGTAPVTAAVSRDHRVLVSRSGLVTVAGGKWTTYRRMAEDTIDEAIRSAGLDPVACTTRGHRLHGYVPDPSSLGDLARYGADAATLTGGDEPDSAASAPLCDGLPFLDSEVDWAVRHEMARTIDDVLGRRTRALFLDARAALAAAPRVAETLRRELGRDGAWADAECRRFESTCRRYLP